jgi:hypothetical protein
MTAPGLNRTMRRADGTIAGGTTLCRSNPARKSEVDSSVVLGASVNERRALGRGISDDCLRPETPAIVIDGE